MAKIYFRPTSILPIVEQVCLHAKYSDHASQPKHSYHLLGSWGHHTQNSHSKSENFTRIYEMHPDSSYLKTLREQLRLPLTQPHPLHYTATPHSSPLHLHIHIQQRKHGISSKPSTLTREMGDRVVVDSVELFSIHTQEDSYQSTHSTFIPESM